MQQKIYPSEMIKIDILDFLKSINEIYSFSIQLNSDLKLTGRFNLDKYRHSAPTIYFIVRLVHKEFEEIIQEKIFCTLNSK